MHFLKVWKLKIHWQILIAMVLGIGVGFLAQGLDGELTLGFTVDDEAGAVVVKARQWAGETALGPAAIHAGDVVVAVDGRAVESAAAFRAAIGTRTVAQTVTLTYRRDGAERTLRAKALIGPDSARSRLLWPFNFVANLFMKLLKMLIVPLILTSMISGVTSIGNLGALGRLGLKTILFYTGTSLLAILVGLILVNAVQPGTGADIPLTAEVSAAQFESKQGFLEEIANIFARMIPENVQGALASNSQILQVIFFSLLFGIFITRVGGEHGALLKRFFEAGFAVMMKIAEFVLIFIPIGVVALITRVVGASGIDVFIPLLKLMGTVTAALLVHGLVTLPLLLWLLGRVSPWKYAQAMSPALLTAFSTSSSSITLPVTMRSVEKRGGVSNRTASFTLPLGATVNMDGTALYECVGVIFLAQYYASTGDFELTLGKQVLVVVAALMASIGAAGIPSAGLVTMTMILSALGLPLEGVMLLLAIDRPLDMLRTVINIWSDSTCTAVIARSEGENVRPMETEETAETGDGGG